MPHAILLESPGGTEKLLWRETEPGAPGRGEVRLRQEAVGVNFIDIYHRTGLYPLPSYPAGLGMEAAGVVEAVGQGVKDFSPGDRVAYAGGATGAYAQMRNLPQERLVRLPDTIGNVEAAAVMLKGLTAHYLLRKTFAVQAGQTVLIHAAAGGVGLLLGQWAKHLGARVIGTAGSEEKAALAQQNGYDKVILYRQEKVSARVRELTGGAGVEVVYDSVGQPTFLDSLDCLKPRGMMVSFGQAGGKVAPLDVNVLSQKGSLFLSRPSLWHYIADEREYRAAAAEMFTLMASGVLRVRIDRTLKLEEAGQAHELLESRQTKGAVVLTV